MSHIEKYSSVHKENLLTQTRIMGRAVFPARPVGEVVILRIMFHLQVILLHM